MQVLKGFSSLRTAPEPAVALGVFDGVHRGHRRVLRAAVRWARARGGSSIAVTFWPHPRGKESLFSLPHRLRLFLSLGLDYALVARFDAAFARMSAEDFVQRVLVGKIGMRACFVGANFRFGHRALGSVALLRRLGKRFGFTVRSIPVAKSGSVVISSTAIRRLISSGELSKAAALLGARVSVFGTVVRGRGMGRKLGFPTANIDPHHEVLPPAGIYAVKVFLGERPVRGVCYIGRRATFSPLRRDCVEVYLFGKFRSLYGRQVTIQFFRRIRNDRAFASPSLLVSQIRKDITFAKRFFLASNTPHR